MFKKEKLKTIQEELRIEIGKKLKKDKVFHKAFTS